MSRAQILDEFFLSRESTTFAWGSHDCCLFAADVILAMTGKDIAAEFRKRYTTPFGALKAIKQITGGNSTQDAVAYCAAKYGLPELQTPLLAQRGDLLLIENGGCLIAGVLHTNGRQAISSGECGLIRLPLTAIRRAWRV